MVRKFGVDDSTGIITQHTRDHKARTPAGSTQFVAASAYLLEKRTGWSLGRRSARPIDLERRARFARIETM
jgi:hypothetical protein